MKIFAIVKALFRRKQLERDLDEELAFHLAMREDKKRSRGAAPDEARYAARREFGNVTRMKELCRDLWTFAPLEAFWRDLRYGARALGKNPSFTTAAILAIALGIGVNTGIFSVLNALALRPLPIPAASQVVSIDQVFHGEIRRNVHGEGSLFSYPEYQVYRANNHVFSGLLAYQPFLQATLGGANPQQLFGVAASCNYFDVLNVRPALGRGLVDSDCAAPGTNAVVLLSEDLWRTTFNADPSLVGKDISLNRARFTVIGIAPAGFTGTEPVPAAFWAPLTMQLALDPQGELLSDENMSWLALLGRVKDGSSLSEVRADLAVIAERLDQRHPGGTTTLSIHFATFLGRPEERGFIFTIGGLILLAVGLVLLIACANVANLLLARASARQREIAIRLSIGASRWQLIRQLLTESLLIALLGGTAGSLLALWSFEAITRFVLAHLPHGFPQLTLNMTPDYRVLAYSLGLTLITGVVFGLAPALHTTRPDLSTAIKADSGGSTGSGRLLRSTLVGLQIAVCMMLLIAAGLLLRGLRSAQTIDPGFEMANVTQAAFDLASQGYSDQRASDFQHAVMEGAAALPGVDAVAEATAIPLSDNHSRSPFLLPGETEGRMLEFNHVSTGFFNLLGIPMVRGRDFTPAEARAASPEIIVTEFTARSLWPGQDPMGKVLRESSGTERVVIGVVKDAQVSRLGENARLYAYLPAGAKEQARMALLVHGRDGFENVQKEIREVVRSLDPQLVIDVTRLEDNLEIWRTPSRIVAALSATLGALALLLASIGVYGVVSYGVSRRIREIGIRMTLGADGIDIIRLLLRQVMRPVLIGGAIGIAGCAAISQILSKVLFGIGSHDPITFIGVPLFLLAIASMASHIPARRATRVDPVVTLRTE
jgi:macrolide transport system ATP-binding/permease protein